MSEVIETPIIEGAEVSALLPQKPPMEMVDKLWFHDFVLLQGSESTDLS